MRTKEAQIMRTQSPSTETGWKPVPLQILSISRVQGALPGHVTVRYYDSPLTLNPNLTLNPTPNPEIKITSKSKIKSIEVALPASVVLPGGSVNGVAVYDAVCKAVSGAKCQVSGPDTPHPALDTSPPDSAPATFGQPTLL